MITEVTPHHLGLILLVGSTSQVLSILNRRGSFKDTNTVRWVMKAILETLATTFGKKVSPAKGLDVGHGRDLGVGG